MSNIDSNTLDKYRRRFHDSGRYTKDGPIFSDRGRCWPWTKHDAKHRFGQFAFLDAHRDTDESGNVLRAQRRPYEVAWELMYGAIPEGKKLVKPCPLDNCCNPMHVDVVVGKKRKRREMPPKTDEQIIDVEVVDNGVPDMITDADELRAIVNGEPVTAPDNVTPIIRRDTGGYFVMAARELNVEHVHEDIEIEIDGQRRWRRIERIVLGPRVVIVAVKLGESGEYGHALAPNAEVKLRYLDQTKLPVTGVAQ